MRGTTIWCLGLYGSASTWMFNAVRLLHGAAEPPVPVKTYFFSGQADFAAFGAPVAHIVKSHEISDQETERELSRRADTILITVRDPRDAVASLMRYHHHAFDRALSHVAQALQLCMRYAADPRASLYTYESCFFEDAATPEAVAAHLGLSLPPQAGAKIFQVLERGNVEAHIARMDRIPGILQDRVSGDLLDPQTHWHTHHAGRSGEIGRWRRELTQAQADTVIAACGSVPVA